MSAGRDEAGRVAWRGAQASLDPAQIVGVDESGSNPAMVLTHAWSPKGERTEDQSPATGKDARGSFEHCGFPLKPQPTRKRV